jgi:hypothetical protein
MYTSYNIKLESVKECQRVKNDRFLRVQNEHIHLLERLSLSKINSFIYILVI